MGESAYVWLGLILVWASVGAAGQTVTGSGTTNTVPVFTGASAVGNSPIAISGGNVGIGTTLPRSAFDVNGGIGVDQGFRLGNYFEFGNTDYYNEAYIAFNATLTTSNISNSSNAFSPAP